MSNESIDKNNDEAMIFIRINPTKHVGMHHLIIRYNGIYEVYTGGHSDRMQRIGTTQLTNSQMRSIRRIINRISDREDWFWTSNCIWRVRIEIGDTHYTFTAGYSVDPARDHLFMQIAEYSPIPIAASNGALLINFNHRGEQTLRHIVYEYTYITPVIPIGSAVLATSITALLVIRIRKRRKQNNNQEQVQ